MNLVVHSSFFCGQQTEGDVASTESSRIPRAGRKLYQKFSESSV